jgi:hypothetical protein
VDFLPALSLPTPSLAQLLQRVLAASIVIGVHGWAAARLAERLGDPGPRHDGRRRFNPLAHLDLLGLLHALFFRVTWMSPLGVDPPKLRGGLAGAFVLTIGASAALAILSALLVLLRPLTLTLLRDSAALTLSTLVTVTSEIAIVTAALHLLPLPPFVGAVWAPWGNRMATAWRSPVVRYVGIAALALASLTGLTDRLTNPIRQTWLAWLGF